MVEEQAKALEDIYKGSFFGRRHKLAWRVPIVCDAIINSTGLQPGASIIDVGCAIGEFVDGLYERGYKARGIEGSTCAKPFLLPRVKHKVAFHDLRYPVSFNGNKTLNKQYDLALCLEVAEHIEPEYADQLVANLCYLSRRIIISAAPPGQHGHHHVNCQPAEYWVEKFNRQGYMRQMLKELAWQNELRPHAHKKGINAYFGNTLFFRRYK